MPQQLEELTAKVLSQQEENTRLKADLLQATQRNLELERQLAATAAADAARQQLTTELMNRLDALRSPAGK